MNVDFLNGGVNKVILHNVEREHGEIIENVKNGIILKAGGVRSFIAYCKVKYAVFNEDGFLE